MSKRILLPFFLIIFILAAIPGRNRALADTADQVPRHAISITVDLDRQTLLGTSRIRLPAGMPLVLHGGPLQITGAVLEQLNTTPVLVRMGPDNTMRVPAAPAPQTLLLSWSLDLSAGRSGDNLLGREGITLAGHWHPVPDRDMLYSLEAVLPGNFTAVCEAETVTEEKGDKTRFRASYDHPIRSLHLAAGPYVVRSVTVGTIRLFTYFFPEDAGLADGYLESAASYLRRYEKLLGPFPFSRYAIVENRLPTGYGMPTFTLLGQAVVRLPFIRDTSLGHEILHSWFGNSVELKGNDNWCEGLTTYLADQSFAEDRDRGWEYRKNQILRYLAYVPRDNTMTLADFQGVGDNRPMAEKIRAIGYDKGAMFFHLLRQRLGDKAFFKALRTFYAEKKYQRASWKDLEETFSRVGGRDLGPLFDQWLHRADLPDISMQLVQVEQQEGASHIIFHLVQHTEQPYTLPVRVVIHTLNERLEQVVELRDKDQKVELVVEDLPTEIVLDPEYDVMRRLAVEERPPILNGFLGSRHQVVLKPDEGAEIYQPLLALFEERGSRIVDSGELKNSELGGASVLFLGPSAHRASLFAGTVRKDGFFVDVRRNPLNSRETMVLVDSSSVAETRAVVRRLRHYGKYSFLHFRNGRIREKRIAPSARGIRRELVRAPAGMPVAGMRSFARIIDDLADSRVVYVGETHTDYGSHLLQLQIIQALYGRDPDLAIGLEMFPRSSQQALDDYIEGRISTEREFIKASRYYSVWGYDYRMYRDIIAYARKHRIPLVALNLDKQIVSQVFRSGCTDGLDESQLAQVAAERDLDLPGYRKRLREIHARHQRSPHGSDFKGFFQAQSMWDETMAESIVNYLRRYPDRRMVVLAGTGHVYRDSAIPPRVARRLPVSQRVVAAENGMETGLEQGRQLDYLVFAPSVSLPPAPKIGVVLNEEKVRFNGSETARMRIVRISPHGKAGEAGLKEQDVILSIGETEIHSIDDIKIELMERQSGDRIRMKILRQHSLLPDEVLEVTVQLSAMQPGAAMPPGHPGK